MLLHGGAILSRHLVQLLHVHYNPTMISGPVVRWGSDLKFSAYVSLLLKAQHLYGEDMSFECSSLDEVALERFRRESESVMEVEDLRPRSSATSFASFGTCPYLCRSAHPRS